MLTGEEKAWEILAGLDPDEVIRNAQAPFDRAAAHYSVISCGMEFHLFPREQKIISVSPGGEVMLQRLAYFFRLSALLYLTSARDIPFTGKLVSPLSLKGGQLFFRGSHVLPLDKVAGKYASDRDGFLKKGLALGGEKKEYGDASFTLFPFPRVPVTLILWEADDEFPARADLLLDSTCEIQAPLDIIWTITMMCVLLML
jgi:hypothetical protein